MDALQKLNEPRYGALGGHPNVAAPVSVHSVNQTANISSSAIRNPKIPSASAKAMPRNIVAV